ncbi:MAG: hypothetical protein HXY38_15975 [Chloroflexi bacterium]|nr:hypothetical protein [Chloroflexota bacterium]
MEKTIRLYTSHKEMKAGDYRYWQSRPVHERIDAGSMLTTLADWLKTGKLDQPRLQGPLACLPRLKPRPRKIGRALAEDAQPRWHPSGMCS